jgi:hypothetical protein
MRLLIALILLGGCDLYFGGGHSDDTTCSNWVGVSQELRDPETGMCETFESGGTCSPDCPCPDFPAVPEHNWAACSGPCEALDETTCLATAGCHASYTDGNTLLGCWETDPNPLEGGSCVGLDAQTCLRHDDCSSTYTVEQGADVFATCIAEPSDPCAVVDCAGQCEVQCTQCDPTALDCTPICQAMCVPDPTCTPDSCAPGYTCVQQCDAVTGNLVGACTITCMPNTACAALPTEAACKGRADCEPVYSGTDCTCYPDGCTCATETYERCQIQQ